MTVESYYCKLQTPTLRLEIESTKFCKQPIDLLVDIKL